jgi:TonB family protein
VEHRSGPPTTGEGKASYLTLRVRSSHVALILAVALHVLLVGVINELPLPPPPPEEPLEFTLTPASAPPPPPSASAAPEEAKQPRSRRRPRPAPPTPVKEREEPAAPPAISPVAPELPPSAEPPEHRAQLPVVELAPEPVPPPKEPTWEEELKAQLRRTTPRLAPRPAGDLAPSAGTIHRVAANDPRMHDEETEQRLMVDHGAFFRRGLESLRGNWHPNEVLRRNRYDRRRRCSARTRTTFAVAVLDRTGNVVEVELKDPSGCDDLDDEAVAAFKRAAKFPRPPRGIFKAPDGTELETARFPVHFIVTFDGGLRLHWQ